MEPGRVSRSIVVDSHHCDEKQDPDRHLSGKSGPDPNLIYKMDTLRKRIRKIDEENTAGTCLDTTLMLGKQCRGSGII